MVPGCLSPWTWAEHHISGRQSCSTFYWKRSRKQDWREPGKTYPRILSVTYTSSKDPPSRVPRNSQSVIFSCGLSIQWACEVISYLEHSSTWKLNLPLSYCLHFSFLNFHNLKHVFFLFWRFVSTFKTVIFFFFWDTKLD